MLGRLKMSIDDCITTYIEMSDKIFTKKHKLVNLRSGEIQGRFDTVALEECMKEVIKKCGLKEDSLLLDDQHAPCKVFVCATSKNTSGIVYLRSYRSTYSPNTRRSTKIWEAARATSAASSFFDPISISFDGLREDFVDGATGANNPIQEVWGEASEIWDFETLKYNLNCLVSIGTGISSIEPFKTGLLEIGQTLARISTATEETAESFKRAHPDIDSSGRYFRFNVSNGLQEIGLEDASQKDQIGAVTRKYMESRDTIKLMQSCVSFMSEKENTRSLIWANRSWQLQKYNSRTDEQRLLDNISLYNHVATHRRLIHKRLRGTTEWFLQHPDFVKWFAGDGPPCLWCSGKIGSGKTIIATSVVEAAIRRSTHSGKAAAVFYYCESDCRNALSSSDILSSFIKQLLLFLRIICKPWPLRLMETIQKFFGIERLDPMYSDLEDTFNLLVDFIPGSTFVLDGLDAVKEKEATMILRTLKRVFITTEGNFSQILILSRPHIGPLDVARLMTGALQISTSGNVLDDIRVYIRETINDKLTYRHELPGGQVILEELKERLIRESSGMFLWVFLQLEVLWETCHTVEGVKSALAALPKGLEETYERCFQRINFQGSCALKALHWVSFAVSPLHFEALGEAAAFGLDDKRWNANKIPPSRFVTSSCANLLVIDPADQCVRFVHPSVKQYLEKAQLEGYPSSPEDGDSQCGELCINYLSFSDFHLGLQKFSNIPMVVPVPPPKNIINTVLQELRLKKFSLPYRNSRKHRTTHKVHIQRTFSPSPNLNQYRFLSYAAASWALHTKRISNKSIVWHQFQQIALCFDETWNFQPWAPGGSSDRSILHSLFGWAVVERHLPLLSLALNVDGIEDVCNLPLIDKNIPGLHVASRLGFKDVVEALLPMCDIDALDIFDSSAIYYASQMGHDDIVKLLIDNGASADSKKFQTLPIYVSIQNGHEAVVRLLFDRARSRSIYLYGETPLHIAARFGQEAVIRVLLTENANIDIEDLFDETPLQEAIKSNQEGAARLLIAEGANIEAMDEKSQTPLMMAVVRGQEDIINLLIAEGANIEAMDREGQTPLMIAVEKGQEDIISLLIAEGANKEARDREGQTPLMRAVVRGQEDIIRLLLREGANMDDFSRSLLSDVSEEED
ncbi:hypothetical protein FQN57_000808 [Myotisia sp. PD_48]|nr:hypothetical protein FQN57_000808 [Myotisia sp. PD_48]